MTKSASRHWSNRLVLQRGFSVLNSVFHFPKKIRLLRNKVVKNETKSCFFYFLRFSSTQRISSQSVPTESEHRARSKT